MRSGLTMIGRSVPLAAAAALVLVLEPGTGAGTGRTSQLAQPRSARARSAATAPAALPGGRWDDRGIAPPEVEYPSWDYNGRFTFARLRFTPSEWGFDDYAWGLDLKWNHDYPQAEQNLMKILQEITLIKPRVVGGNILEISDPRLFQHPWAYICEPAFWRPSDEDINTLREYLLRGGFLMVDDMFDRGVPLQWDNIDRQVHRMFPAATLYPLDLSHPVFRAFFELEDLDFQDPAVARFGFAGKIYGVFEDNDPAKRLLMVINYAMDIGDYWEWSDVAGIYPKHMTEKGFKVGVNYVIYGMLH